jgi:hypothetical protein
MQPPVYWSLISAIYRQHPDPKDTSEFNYSEPSAKAMGWAPYAVYVFALSLLHHGYLLLLEWLEVGNFLDFL